MLVFDNDDVKNALSMDVCLDAIEETYRDYGQGQAVNIPRADMLTPHPQEGYFYEFKTMSGAVPRYDICALRLSSSVITRPSWDRWVFRYCATWAPPCLGRNASLASGESRH